MINDYPIDIQAMAEELARLRPPIIPADSLYFPFGKYKGVRFEKIPGGYLRHVLSFGNLSPSLREIVEHELAKRHPPGEPLDNEIRR